MIDRSLYKVGVVLSVDSSKSSKTLRICRVNVGDEENPITVVTSASNVRDGSRIVVAPAGSTFIDDEGEEQTVTKASVGGTMSEGMLCDSAMLGWKGGAKGVAAVVPESFDVGSEPPAEKPRPKGAGDGDDAPPPASAAPGLFEKKLTKEEKKKLAEEKRKARKAAKAAKKAAEEGAD
uniref:tRNA-binding domain-containing protein n=1 Tax=Trieres chinensis TaxID=1514140 RepID=A0A7S2EV43_TRICV|mmetsp:Transcript_4803/g.10134  ORF Transcript_4803/g.10134 Transcript_4803/m.10134 type:complete len:178 (+) Transcript_4803:32-565(+)|eukprot:CAMPEP_0183306974 /NCGR_PEP_ID=MMETSP0160_2-20130417/15327_1 /TAXON_ID=2839 ORGANISM="Odontella Sinensis, Strain Grunow 1884" /NCGR_SAMPLE_ID=MMETSP0160_2 /ASSEMBLY_ACC=CAM_ASM_000250 /LENGTH=177 /DNA_ID=CAMNT_0025470461 /DNA_START=32 /DNA_END=565 /DNA_ORIENTATION=+